MPRPLPPGEVCQDPALVGTPLPAVAAEGGCGIAAPVRVTTAAGITLEPPAILACDTARALAEWLRGGARPAFAALGHRLEAVAVADAYSCRNRNRAAEGKRSEHAFGRAIDISGFRLGDGTTVSVGAGWTSPRWSPVLRRVHDAGCGPFGTVLGPAANPLHADHLHLDSARRRSGPYCRVRSAAATPDPRSRCNLCVPLKCRAPTSFTVSSNHIKTSIPVAEEVGFEPTEGLRLRRFSRPVQSTALPLLPTPCRTRGWSRYAKGQGAVAACIRCGRGLQRDRRAPRPRSRRSGVGSVPPARGRPPLSGAARRG